MARYKVLKRSFINGQIQEVGAIVEYEGEVGSNLGPEDTEIVPTPGDINAFPPANPADLPKPKPKPKAKPKADGATENPSQGQSQMSEAKSTEPAK